jgi:UTP-glucose-1-phosphate uridylyltransferase
MLWFGWCVSKMVKPTLLVLAAGMGSRYGGLKQIDPVGPNGETILDYSVFDAVRAGFGRVVFVIRRDFEDVFRSRVAAKYAGRVPVDLVFQSVDALPTGFSAPVGREKPWGTGHATWCARDVVREPFAVINADDFYGADSFRRLAVFLSSARPQTAAMAGFHLGNTLSESGAVSRGICEVKNGHLARVVERTGIVAAEVSAASELRPDTVVSMNCWGFMPDFFAPLEQEFVRFLQTSAVENPLKAEYYLPSAVSQLIQSGSLRVEVLATESRWFGVTYREDKPRVVESIAELVRRGDYPPTLWQG